MIDKKWLVQLLYRPIDKVKGISQEQLDAVIEILPAIKVIYDIVNEFKNLLKSKEPKKLSPWIEKASSFKSPEFDSFINGLRSDIVAVENAIETDYNNGLAEGSVNKLKLIKRIMYGRCGFSMLKNKTLKLEHNRRFN